jgi:type I restriction enzyme S subunit
MSFTVSIDELIASSTNLLLGKKDEWPRIRIGEIAKILNGYAFSSEKFHNNKGMPLIRIRDIVRGYTETFYDGPYDPLYLVSPGDLLIGMDGDFNSSLWKGQPGLLNQRVCKLKITSDKCDLKFLSYLLPGYLFAINQSTSSVTVKHLSSRTISEIPIPLPPLDEQQRIVARIEELFTQLDAGVAALEAVRAQVRRYRQAVLQAAVTGRLSTSWRKKQYDENGGVSIDRSLPTGWKNETLGNLGRVIGGLTKNQKRDHFPMRLPYISVGNVYANELRLEEVNEIGVLENELERILLKKDDLLVVEGNGSPDQIGRAALWDGSIDPCVHQNHIIKVRLEHPEMGRFIMLWLLSTSGREKIKKLASSTSGLYTLSISKVASIPVTLPPIEEQNVIISEVERRISVVDQMDKTIEIALRQAARLRQSILQRAFTGRL